MTDLFREAVEAAREAESSGGSVNGVCSCSDCDEHRRAILIAALPYLRRMLAEELRAEADNYVADEWSGFWAAADFLIRQEDR